MNILVEVDRWSPGDRGPVQALGQCIEGINGWMMQILLQLNKDQTRVVVFKRRGSVSPEISL